MNQQTLNSDIKALKEKKKKKEEAIGETHTRVKYQHSFLQFISVEFQVLFFG